MSPPSATPRAELITGASSGLCRALAEVALVHHDTVIASDILRLARHKMLALAHDFGTWKGLPITTTFPRQ
jgi:NAD(P)-dependent dehydrogenase (short-subunit alcohol dehydrogenase family)